MQVTTIKLATYLEPTTMDECHLHHSGVQGGGHHRAGSSYRDRQCLSRLAKEQWACEGMALEQNGLSLILTSCFTQQQSKFGKL